MPSTLVDIDQSIARHFELDYIACDAYHESGSLIELLEDTAMVLGQHGKPILVTEFGGNWYGASAPRLKADLHSGIWSSAFLPLSGAPLFWWFDFLEKHRLGGEFAAFRRFLAGENARDYSRTPRQVKLRAEHLRILDVGSLAMVGLRSARVYLFDKQAASLWVEPANLAAVPPVDIEIEDLAAGRYRVEFWDTGTGRKAQEHEAESTGGTLRVTTPPFKRDLAIKVDAAPPGPRPTTGGEKR